MPAGTCPKCNVQMDATGTTSEFPDCNTWTCPSCGLVEPELGSLMIEDDWLGNRPFDPELDEMPDWASAEGDNK